MSSPEPSFQRASGDAYWLQTAGKTIGFQAPPGSSLPGAPTLAQTWAVAGGLYFFLGAEPSDPAAFLGELPPYLREVGWPGGPRFLWLQSGDGPRSQLAGQLLALTPAGTVRQRVDFGFGGYTLSVAAGSTVALASEAQGWGFAFGGNPPEATLFSPGGEYPIGSGPLLLPLAGPTPGCWRLGIELANGGQAESDFQRLGVGIRYFCPHPEANPELGKGEGVYVRALELPTLLQPTPPLKLSLTIDPLQPLASDRTHLSFFGSGTAPGSMQTSFATARGHGVTLQPLAGAGAVPDARLAFAVQPLFVGPGGVPTENYLTPEGAFEIGWSGPAEPGLRRMLCGSSGLEYLGLAAGANRLLFKPGGNAFAPLVPSDDPQLPPLSPLGTTAWVTAAGAAAPHYYAQPEEAPLFKAPPGPLADDSIGSVFLDFLEVPALAMPADGSGPAFPVAPLRGLSAADVALARRLEAAAIAPARRRALLPVNAPATSEREEVPATEAVGVTPQGLGVGVAADGESWSWLGIANDSVGSEEGPDLRFTKVSGQFRAAMQTNRLFLVIANAEEFAGDGSVAYRLTAAGLATLAAAGTVPAPVLAAVKSAFATAGYPVYKTEAEFETALLAASTEAGQYKLDFERVAGQLVATIEDWRFQLSPRNWTSPDRQAFLVFKLARGRSLRELVGDLTAWSWSAAAAVPGGTTADTQRELQRIFADTDAAYASTSGGERESPYAGVAALLDDRAWTGVIAFNCEAPLSGLPEPLQALAAGIDAKRFHAHHIGFDTTPFGAQPGQLEFGRSSAFGLIDYRDETDQYASSDVPYAFKTQRLTVAFRNSTISSFSSRVQLLVNRLFGSTVQLYPTEHGNNVVLDGVYQRQLAPDGSSHGTYVFSTTGQNRAQTEESALREVVLRSAQLTTTRPAGDDPTAPILATFSFAGDLRFYEPADCDPFSFGPAREDVQPAPAPVPALTDPVPQPAESGLRFGGLDIAMSFKLSELEPKPTFTVSTETLSFDLANSRSRPDSLFARFPLRLQGLIAASGQPPASQGFAPISAPLQQSAMADSWYGLLFELDLGTFGALAGSAGLTLGLVVGWSTGGTQDEPAVYVGVQLPGTRQQLGAQLPLEGVLSLAFRSIELAAVPGESGREYLLRFRNFALRVLGISLPPGHTDITLFANPLQSGATKLGWYAAYSADKDPKKKQLLTRGAGGQ
jgi:hypothetical protein